MSRTLRNADQEFVLLRDVDRRQRVDQLANAGRVNTDCAEQTALLDLANDLDDSLRSSRRRPRWSIRRRRKVEELRRDGLAALEHAGVAPGMRPSSQRCVSRSRPRTAMPNKSSRPPPSIPTTTTSERSRISSWVSVGSALCTSILCLASDQCAATGRPRHRGVGSRTVPCRRARAIGLEILPLQERHVDRAPMLGFTSPQNCARATRRFRASPAGTRRGPAAREGRGGHRARRAHCAVPGETPQPATACSAW